MTLLPPILFLLSLTAWAQHAPAPSGQEAAASSSGPCNRAKHRPIDFSPGHWTVLTGGQPAGQNCIESRHGGCALVERLISARGDFARTRLDAYDDATSHWHQGRVHGSDTLLNASGSIREAKTVLRGEVPGLDGMLVATRMTGTPRENGSARQHWETPAEGAGWTTLLDGDDDRKTE